MTLCVCVFVGGDMWRFSGRAMGIMISLYTAMSLLYKTWKRSKAALGIVGNSIDLLVGISHNA